MKNHLLLMIVFLLHFSCIGKTDRIGSSYQIISIDFDDSQLLDIRDSLTQDIRIINLQTTDNSLLTHIEQVEFKDNKIFIYDKGRVLAFDTRGNYLYNVGKRGSGPGEYTQVSSFFFEDDKICIYDSNLQTLFYYDQNGGFLTSKKVKESMASLYPVSNEQFVGRKKYQGDRVKVSSLALLDPDLNLLYNVENRHLTSGIGVFDHCFSYEEAILYWEFLNDTIYSIQERAVKPAWYVDFQQYKIPSIERKDRDISGILSYLESTDTQYAVGVRYVHQDESYIRFIFAFNENIYYVKHRKETHKTELFQLLDSTKMLEVHYFMKFFESAVILVANSPEDYDTNPSLLIIKES